MLCPFDCPVLIPVYYLNRWLQPDSIVPYPYDPQSYDRYSYVRNNPVNRIDPSGHKDKEDCDNCYGGGWSGPKNYLPPEEQISAEEISEEYWETHKTSPESSKSVDLDSAMEGSFTPEDAEDVTMDQFDDFGEPPDKDFREVEDGARPYRDYDNESTGRTTPENTLEVNAMEEHKRIQRLVNR